MEAVGDTNHDASDGSEQRRKEGGRSWAGWAGRPFQKLKSVAFSMTKAAAAARQKDRAHFQPDTTQHDTTQHNAVVLARTDARSSSRVAA